MIGRINNVNSYYNYCPTFPRDKMPITKNTDINPFQLAPQLDKDVFQISNPPKIIALASASNQEDKPEVSKKATEEDLAALGAKEVLYQLTESTVFKANPYLAIATLLGVDFEEEGDAFKYGAQTGEIGDFGDDYSAYFKQMWKNADKSYWSAAVEGFRLPANVLSITWADGMQTLGVALSKVLGEDMASFVGSTISAAGTALNSVSDVAVETLKAHGVLYQTSLQATLAV